MHPLFSLAIPDKTASTVVVNGPQHYNNHYDRALEGLTKADMDSN